MIHKRTACRLLAVLILCVLCTGQAQAGAIREKMNRTGAKISELENALDKAEQDISVYEKEQQALETDISREQEKISSLSAELDQTKDALEKTQDAMEKTQKELKQSREDSREQYRQMKLRIRFMYEYSVGNMILYVLDAGTFPEALRRANYFQAIVNYDRQKLEEYKETTRKIKKAKEALVSQKEDLETLEKEQSEKIAAIDAAIGELKAKLGSKLAQIQNSRALRQKYEQELEQQKKYEEELERQKAEEDRKRQEEIRRQEEALANRQGSGSDTWQENSGTYSAGDLELLSTIIYCEAGNQSYEGQLAVGSVVMNRVASRSFPNSISGVIYQSGQFSPVASGRFASALAAGLGNRCKSAAQDVLNGRRNVNCLYFRVNNGLIDGLVIGDHVFY